MSAKYSPERIDTSILNPGNLECIVIEPDVRPIKYVRADTITNGHFDVLSEIGSERQRQISKGYDTAHDDRHENGSLSDVGGYLAIAASYQVCKACVPFDVRCECKFMGGISIMEDNARDNLVKAAALLVAEIERIDREGVL